MKIPFSIDYRPQIESGEYKVETKSGSPIRVLAWDLPYDFPIATAEFTEDNRVIVESYSVDGWVGYGEKENNLVIVTPEPELTEFEDKLVSFAAQCDGLWDTAEEDVKKWARELLALVKKELCKDCAANLEGYIKGREDARKEMEYRHEGPTIPAFWPPCYYGKECTNPSRDCINCPRQSTIGINTTTGTSTSKVEGK